jgi:hypothetical protein
MDVEGRAPEQPARRRRRAAARRLAVRRRRAAAGALMVSTAALAAGVLAGARAGGEGDERTGGEAAVPVPARPSELPTGGRRIFPAHRVVAYYGAPQDEELGALGVGTPDEAVARLRRQARAYERGSRPVLLALELLASVAAGSPGDGGLYRTRQPDRVIRRYLAAARRFRALLILDVQPGRADFASEVRGLRRWLEEPDVGLALDPEWHVGPGQVPGQVIGSVDVSVVNRISAELADVVRRQHLPEKLLVVHQFTKDMIRGKAALVRRPGVALTMNVDGFGDQPNKLAKYRSFTSETVRFHDGFKLFYREDTNLMTPLEVLRMRPVPDLVVYE